jgi:hypothetical protein
MSTNLSVSNKLWLELLHAEVCWSLADRGVDVLIIKGPSTGDWLYPEGDRESADVDVLLRPSQWDAAVAALMVRGFEPTYSGFRETESALHSLDLQRADPQQGRHGVDLHRYFPGIELDAEAAFDVLWADRSPAEQAGMPVWFPNIPSRALIVGLHAARQPYVEKTQKDLQLALAALSHEEIAGLAELARRLRAQGPLRAGLETRPEASHYIEELGLEDVEVPPYWRLLSQGADLLSIELERIRSLPPRQRAGAMVRWLFPSAASLRARHPEAASGHLALGRVYMQRWVSGMRRLPMALPKGRAARHPAE